MKNKIFRFFIIFLFSIFVLNDTFAQKEFTINFTKVENLDTNNLKKKVVKWLTNDEKRPKKAVILSSILPGAGQIYNKKHAWFGLLSSYAAIGGASYYCYYNTQFYNAYRDEYRYRIENPGKLKLFKSTQLETVRLRRNTYQTSKEKSYFMIIGAYVYCIGEAFVTAHLKTFDVSDNISFQFKPSPDKIGFGFYGTIK